MPLSKKSADSTRFNRTVSAFTKAEMTRLGIIVLANSRQCAAPSKIAPTGPQSQKEGLIVMKNISHKPVADPQLVYAEVNRMVGTLPDATLAGKLIQIELSIESLDVTSANYFAETYALIMRKCHILTVSGASFEGMQTIAKFCSDRFRAEDSLCASTPDRFVAYWDTTKKSKQGIGAIIDTQRFELTYIREAVTKPKSRTQNAQATISILGIDKKPKTIGRSLSDHAALHPELYPAQATVDQFLS
jgi:hypothetical protein